MVFPESDRVIYANNTLEEVVCQAKFPTILKISQAQVEFQERIRATYPLLELKPAVEFPPEVPADMARVMGSRIGNVSHFLSREKVWDASLYREFLALTCSAYRRWEEFRERFQVPFQALAEIYSPAFYTRIGLRYRNVIRRGKLGLDGVPWPQLLRPEICGELAANEIGTKVEQASRELVVGLGEGAKVRLVHGLAESDSYVIDADFYTESEIEAANVIGQLDAFNRESGRLIRWAITDRLHEAMGPAPV
jgi:uncharacterized protein (TIGR04255 family)